MSISFKTKAGAYIVYNNNKQTERAYIGE